MTEDLASRRGGSGADAHIEPAPKRNKRKTESKLGSSAPTQKKAGRPRIGTPHTVRLPPDEEKFISDLGDGVFPEGVRVAVRQMVLLGRPLRLDAYTSTPLQVARPGEPLAPLIEAAMRGEFAKLLGPTGLLTQEIGEELMEFSARLGNGDALAGLMRALRVTRKMGVGAVKRLDHGTDL
jgi:hypothetical protein